MSLKERTINVDIMTKEYTKLKYKQGDSNQTLKFKFYKNGSELDLTGYVAGIFYEKPNNEILEKTGTISTNTVTTTITSGVLNTAGVVKTEIFLTKDTEVTISFTILIEVESSIDKNAAVQEKEEWDVIRDLLINGSNVSLIDDSLTATNKTWSSSKIDSQIKDITDNLNFTLTIGSDGLLYLSDGKGNLLGNGIFIENATVINKGIVVFNADFSNVNLNTEQFTTWNGRVYDGAIYEIGTCTDNQLHLTSTYDDTNSRWIKQICHTAGLFESDNFTCEFKAKFDGKAGSWQNVITYGTGTYWTSGMYSDGVKWPAGGEIDAFEQAGGYAENPNSFKTPTVHYGAGTESGYPNTHEFMRGFSSETQFTTDEWHIFKFTLKNGLVQIYIDDELKQEYDFSNCSVNNNYLYNYNPFLKPQAFYLDGSCSSSSDTSNTYDFVIDYFKIYQDEKVDTTSLSIFPQMWAKGTDLIFPTGAEIFLDKEFTPSNVSNKACTWTSSNPNVASVVQGYVKTLAEGTTTITATNGNVSATYDLTVNNNSKNVPCVGLVIENTSVQLDEGLSTELKTYIYPKFTTDSLQVSYGTSGIVTYDGTTLTGLSAGTTTVTVSCGEQSINFNVTIKAVSKDPVLSYTFDPSSAQESVVVENQGTLGLDYNLTVNYALINPSYPDIGITTPTALTIPTRQAGEPYVIVADLYDSSDRTVQGLIQNSSKIYFTETENSANQPNIASTFANISSGGKWQMVYNGSPYETMVDNPCRIALWRDNTGKTYIYSSKDDSEKTLSNSSDNVYIKDIVKINLIKARITKLDIYYCNKTVDEVKALVNSYSS